MLFNIVQVAVLALSCLICYIVKHLLTLSDIIRYQPILLDIVTFCPILSDIVQIFNEQKLVLGLQHIIVTVKVKVKVKVQMEKFRNIGVLP